MKTAKIFIRHRLNKLTELSQCSAEQGAEIDLRSDVSQSGEIHLAHDPGIRGENLSAWLQEYLARGITGPVILNTKEDLLEEPAIALLERLQIKNYLFLDTAMPTLLRWVKKGYGKHFFLRHSKFEPVDPILSFQGSVDWVWVDCFEGVPVPVQGLEQLKKAGFKLCLVSPELQKHSLKEKMAAFREIYQLADAICTKEPELWQKI